MSGRRKPIWPEPGPILIFQGEFPLVAPSVNEAYKKVTVKIKKGEKAGMKVDRIGASAKLRAFKKSAATYLNDHDRWYRHKELLSILSSEKVKNRDNKEPIEVYILFVNATMWARDVDGGAKFVQDAVCAKLGIRDSTSVRMILDKRSVQELGGEPRCEISVLWLDEIPPVLTFPRAQGATA